MRKILIIHTRDLFDTACLFTKLATDSVDRITTEEYNFDYLDVGDYTDIVMLGFSYSPEQIEQYYMKSGVLHILTIDYHKWDHPLKNLAIYKDKMPFLNYRGKWAVLLDKERTTITKYVEETL
jgi:hypothetical protein